MLLFPYCSVVDGTKLYDARSFPVPRNGLELGQEKSPGHSGSFLKVGSILISFDIYYVLCRFDMEFWRQEMGLRIYVSGGCYADFT